MKIGLFSDIHLEHRDVEDALTFLKKVEKAAAEGVELFVNAGDLHHEFNVQYQMALACTKVLPLRPLPPYVQVQGNHDYYFDTWRDDEIAVSQHGNGLKFLSGTMWTDFDGDPFAEFRAQQSISDFRFIEECTSLKMSQQFERFRQAVEDEKPDVVVSHFAPSPKSIVEQWQGHPLNSYFCPDMLSKLEHWPKLWLHGHIHNPVDYEINRETLTLGYVGKLPGRLNGTCRVVANPLGYPTETYERVEDYQIKVIEIDD